MAELSLRERLQPSLLDRLIDDERLLTLFDITVRREELRRLDLNERSLTEILVAQGLRPTEGAAATSASPDLLQCRFVAPIGRVSLSQLKALQLKPPGAPQGVQLQSLCQIEARNVHNDLQESAERRFVSMRKLRDYVCRDLGSLLNSMSLDTSTELERYPEVRNSVLNYGMPSLAGRSVASIDGQKTAARIQEVIRRFEPRLTRVHVTRDTEREGAVEHQLCFRIEAMLWGQPAPQKIVLRTRIDPETGDVSVADSGG